MNNRILVGAAAFGLASAALIALPASAQAAASSPGVPVVTLAMKGTQATVSQSTMRPGIVEFHVGRTLTSPENGPSQISVMSTDDYDQVISLLGPVFAEEFGNPASMAAAAQSMAQIRTISTWYSGATTGSVWQVYLPAGTYYVLDVPGAVQGAAQPATFTVVGDPRTATLHPTAGTVRAISVEGGNAFVAKGMSRLGNGWLKFANSAKEVHFLDMTGVKATTSAAQVRKGFQSNKDPKWVTGPNVSVDVISPGVSIALKSPLTGGRYLVDCFIPSETDGMPHALMGMWKLVNVG